MNLENLINKSSAVKATAEDIQQGNQAYRQICHNSLKAEAALENNLLRQALVESQNGLLLLKKEQDKSLEAMNRTIASLGTQVRSLAGANTILADKMEQEVAKTQTAANKIIAEYKNALSKIIDNANKYTDSRSTIDTCMLIMTIISFLISIFLIWKVVC